MISDQIGGLVELDPSFKISLLRGTIINKTKWQKKAKLDASNPQKRSPKYQNLTWSLR